MSCRSGSRSVFFAIIVLAAGTWMANAVRQKRSFLVWLGVLTCGLILVQGAYRHLTLDQQLQLWDQRGHRYVPSNSRGTFDTDYLAGVFLRKRGRSEDLLATDNIGAVGYVSGVRVLDTLGLVSRQVAERIYHGDRK